MRKPEEIKRDIGKLNHELSKSIEFYKKERTLLVVHSFQWIEEIHYDLPKDKEELTKWVKDYVKEKIHPTAEPITISENIGTICYSGDVVGSEIVSRMVEVTF